MEEKLKIFFCEDDENLGMLLREYLQAKGYVTDLFSDGEAGYKGPRVPARSRSPQERRYPGLGQGLRPMWNRPRESPRTADRA